MKKCLTRLAALFAAAVLLAACGRTPETTAAETEDVTGRYYLTATNGKTAAEVNEDRWLRLKDDGKAVLQLGFDQLEYKWRLKEDGKLTLTLDGEKITGEVKDGVITITLDGAERVFVMGKNAARKYIEENGGLLPAPTTASATTSAVPETTAAAVFDPDIRFSGTDQYGNTIDENVFREHALTMINFWEPWCGPCVSEMPELEQLYQDYAGRFQIVGVYWTEANAAQTLKETGVTYPVILYDAVFAQYQTGYVPTTIFVGPDGKVIGEPYIGARSYAGWNEIVSALIGQ